MESNNIPAPLADALKKDIVLENNLGGYNAIVKTRDEFTNLLPFLEYVDYLRIDCQVELGRLSGLTNLKQIHFKKTQLGADLDVLQTIPNLKRIDFRGELIDELGWKAISKCNLEKVFIYGECTDSNLLSFSSMSSLEKIYLESKVVTMEGVEQLQALPNLRVVVCYSLDEVRLLSFQENLPYWQRNQQ